MDILNIVKDHWGLENVKLIKEIEVKGDRQVLFIENDGKQFVLKSFGDEVTGNKIKRYTESLGFLKEKGFSEAPRIISSVDGSLYKKVQDRYFYLYEYIEGEQLEKNKEDLYKLGQVTAKLHMMKGYEFKSCLDVEERISNMLKRFHDKPFKKKYDQIVNELPKFNEMEQVFIHTDISAHNAVKNKSGDVVLIDFDDAGMGSLFIDAGYPLITSYVQYNGGNITIEYENGRAFYDGYFSVREMDGHEKELIFKGAVFMQLMYMPCYGDEGVIPMWNILKKALDNKEEMMRKILNV